MRPSVEFQGTIKTRGQTPTIDDVIAGKRDELKKMRPEIDEIMVATEVKDLGGKTGAGYEATLTGTIYFKPGAQPDTAEVERAGQECFDYDFRVLPMIVLDTTSKTATGAPILC